ncbi:MAG: hypothetical protein ABSH03_09260 [Candidatus Lustribacter sp.]|jgi:hypothetical protein
MATVEVVPFDDLPWGSLGTHREYHIEIKKPIHGREGALDNFRLTFNRGLGGTENQPRHRHNFDQIRMPLAGRVSYGPKRWIEAGDIGYFPEGLHYGPTEDHRDVGTSGLTLQFGGASGLGFLSSDQMLAATRALEGLGTFEKGLFWRETAGGKRKPQDAFEAMWEHVNGRRIEYPKPRYTDQIVMRPANYAWQGLPDAPGVQIKPLGDFTERHVTVQLLRLEPGAAATLGPRGGTQACVVLNGAGTVDGSAASTYASIKIDPGARARIATDGGIEMVVFGLPIFEAAAGAERAGATSEQRETVNA